MIPRHVKTNQMRTNLILRLKIPAKSTMMMINQKLVKISATKADQLP